MFKGEKLTEKEQELIDIVTPDDGDKEMDASLHDKAFKTFDNETRWLINKSFELLNTNDEVEPPIVFAFNVQHELIMTLAKRVEELRNANEQIVNMFLDKEEKDELTRKTEEK
jgi:uncharacterized protein YccT (UPF0319 family)